MAFIDLFYEKPLTPTSGRAEQSWFTSAKQVLSNSIAAVTVPLASASGALKTAASFSAPVVNKIAQNAVANPLKSLWHGTLGYTGLSLVGKSEKLKKEVANAPASLDQWTTNTANFIDNPNYDTGMKVIKENPAITTLAVGGGGLAVGKYALPFMYNLFLSGNQNKQLQNQQKNLYSGGGFSPAPSKQELKAELQIEKLRTEQEKDLQEMENKALALKSENELKALKYAADSNLAIEKEKTKQLELASKVPVAGVPNAPTTAKITKKTTKKSKKKKKVVKKKKKTTKYKKTKKRKR